MNKTLSGPRTRVLSAVVRWLALLLLLGGMVQPVAAQQRWLLVFDTSGAMKKRLPALNSEVIKLFATCMNDSLQPGDSIGVWTYSDKVYAGGYPLITWQPANAMNVATNLMQFVRSQKYKGDSDIRVVGDLAERVIRRSERLTIVIFCDGMSEINWTPYDDGINQNMDAAASECAKNRQPVVLLIRTQQGKFVAATVNYPPALVTVPRFPPLEVAPPPAKPLPPPPPPPSLPPLIIVGNTAGTDVTATARFLATNSVPPPSPPPVNPPSANIQPVQPAPPAPTATITELPTPAPAPVAPPATATFTTETSTTAPAAPAPPPAPNETETPAPTAPAPTMAAPVTSSNPAPTNAVAGTTDTGPDRSTMILLAVGAGLFGAAVVLVIWLATRNRRPRSSIITSLMSEDPRQRK